MNIIIISGPACSGKTHLAASIVAAVAPEKGDYTIAATRNNCRVYTQLELVRRLWKEKNVIVFDNFREGDRALTDEICRMYDSDDGDFHVIVVTDELCVSSELTLRGTVIKTKRRTSKVLSPDDIANESVPGLYLEETVCPYPEREVCEGCSRYIEDEGICDMEI